MSHADVFNDIYRRNVWGVGSGPGSVPQFARSYMGYLQNFMRSNAVRSVLDVGCGDWQFSRYMDWSGIAYTGIDVSSVVLLTTRTFGRDGVRFAEMDAAHDALPSADLLLAKDVLQHWPNEDVSRFLAQLPRFRYALITNGFPPGSETQLNSDIAAGGFRPLDLSRAPFGLPGAFVFWFEAVEPKFVFLWTNPATPG
jgi:SAM-dependent methyltransferase